MPRRVWTYPSGMGWDALNMISTVGAFILAAGVLLFVIDLFLRLRPGEQGPENPWGAGTLEWLPTDVYSTRSIPHVASREPLWDQPNLAAEVEAGAHYLPNAPTGGPRDDRDLADRGRAAICDPHGRPEAGRIFSRRCSRRPSSCCSRSRW